MKKLILILSLLAPCAFAQVTPVNLSKTVTTAGTRVRFSTGNEKPASIYVEALGANAGVVYIGLSNVSSTVYIARLSAGQGFGLSSDSDGNARVGANLKLSDYYVDAATNGDKIQVTYMYRSGP